MATQTLGITFQYSHTIGRGEFSGPGFRNPVAVARGEDDTMYVVNRSYEYRPDGKRITICTVDEDYVGEFARGVHTAGETEENENDGSLIWPTSVAIDSKGNVYVADEWLNRISMFDADGEWLGKWGAKGAGDGELDGPSGMAFDADDNLFIVDSKNNRVQKFTGDGQFIAKFGTAGSGDGELNLPWGISMDKDGNVFIADWGNDRIQKFAGDGAHLASYGTSGRGDGEFHRPAGVAVDANGYIYVADWGNERVQVLDAAGGFVQKLRGEATLSAWAANFLAINVEEGDARSRANLEPEIDYFVDDPHEESSHIEKYFWSPVSVKLDRDGNLYVTESNRHRIQVYQPTR